MKKKILTTLSVVLVLGMAALGILAYLTDQDSDANVMTLGNVDIEQNEYQRVQNEDGTYKTDTIDNQTSYVLEDFEQGKALLPIVGDPSTGAAGWDSTTVRMSQVGSYGGMQVFAGKNAEDKFVVVKNTGKTDAYVRTLVAIEVGSTDGSLIGTSCHSNWSNNSVGIVNIDGNNYYVYEYVYKGASDNSRHVNGILPAGDTAYPNLSQVYIKSVATNEDCAAIDGNSNGTLDILVLSQAVQAEGFDSAAAALTAGFGEANVANVQKWFAGTDIPKVFSYEGVKYVTEENAVTVTSEGGDTIYRGILSEGQANAENIIINEGIVRLNNRALCKDMNLKTVQLPNSLTYIDEGVFQQSGFVSIEIPENVTYIGKTAFGACPDLEKIVIKAKNVTFANYVGRDSGKLKEVYIHSDSVTFESGSMYFTNAQTGDASNITFYVSNQTVADALYNSSSASRSYGMLIKSIDGATTYYNTLK